MSDHDNFKKHWHDIGEPDLEYFRKENSKWCSFNKNLGTFLDEFEYRIKGDKHWKLRKKWIDSGFILPIEYLSTFDGKYALTDTPKWDFNTKYREGDLLVTDKNKKDQGKHYRFEYRGIKLDPARICKIYGVNSLLVGQAIKKLLVAGGRGNKSYEQDLKDVICAVNRELEMIKEDKEA